MKNNIENISIKIIVSDPWDFVTAEGSGPFRAQIIKTTKEESGRLRALIKLDTPIMFDKLTYEYLVAENRHLQHPLDEIVSGTKIPCSLTVTSPERAKSSNPTDLSWWRGGGTLTATIELDSTN
jgi:hypothetical protein